MRQVTRPVWAEVNLAHVEHNVRQFTQVLSPGCQLMAVVKANAYGHGDIEVARTALAHGATWLAVARADEGVRLRRAGIAAPVLVLGATPREQLEVCVAKDLILTVYEWEMVQALSNMARRLHKTVRVHIKVDTGMGRLGMCPDQMVDFVKRIKGLPGIEVQGIFTHFASSDVPDGDYVRWQWQRFSWVLRELKSAGLDIPLKHCANTAATMLIPETHMDMVRVGLGLYGMYPCAEHTLELRPAMSVKTQVGAIKRVSAGTAISYHSTHVTWKDTNIITLPVGYADGFNRRMGNRAQVLIQGRRFPVVGKITMDHCMVDVDDTSVEIGEEVVMLGTQNDETITSEQWANWLETINYEVTCMLSSRVPRVYR